MKGFGGIGSLVSSGYYKALSVDASSLCILVFVALNIMPCLVELFGA